MTMTRSLMLAALLLVPRVTWAQGMLNPAQWYIDNSIYSTRVFNSAVANSMLDRSRAGRAAPAKAAPAREDVTRFRESATSRLPAVLSANTAGISATPAEARALFESHIALYRKTAQTDGFPANDLAYAFEYFVVNNYQIVHDLVNVPYDKDPYVKHGRDGFERISLMSEKKLKMVTMPQERTVYQQFRTRLADNPAIRRMTDAEKQESAELMATMLGINFAAYMKALDSGSDRDLQVAHDMARQGLEKLLGVPMAQIRITNAGLELGARP